MMVSCNYKFMFLVCRHEVSSFPTTLITEMSNFFGVGDSAQNFLFFAETFLAVVAVTSKHLILVFSGNMFDGR